MRIVLAAIAFFAFMTILLFKSTFVIPLTPVQYALMVLWNACLAAAVAVIFKRMLKAHEARPLQRVRAR